MRWRTACLGLLSCLAPVVSVAGTDPPSSPPPLATLTPARGFIDDPLLLSPDGRALYYVTTDGATWAELHRAALPDPGKPAPGAPADVTVPGAPLYPQALHLLPGGRVLVIEQDPETSARSAVVLDPGAAPQPGKPNKPARLGPADDITVATVNGHPQIVLYSAPKTREQPGELRLRLVDAATLRPGVTRTLRTLPGEGAINIGGGRDAPPAVPQGIAQRYLTLLLRQPGEFDKKSDIRKPERVVAYDLLSSKITASAPIQSQGAVAELAALRGRHPGETTFLAHLPESQRVELIRGFGGATGDPFLGVRLPITWPRPFALYEPATLRYQATEESLFASLTVDPVNAAAVARKKADPDILDLCAVDPQTGAARRLLALPGNARPTTWTAVSLPSGGARFAILRKHKGFARGGTTVELHDALVAPAPPTGQRPPPGAAP